MKGAATLAAGSGHADTGAGVLVARAVFPGPSHWVPVLFVSMAGLAARPLTACLDHAHGRESPDACRVAGEIDDLARRFAWTRLELWKREDRAMGAILEDYWACWSSICGREL